MTQHSALSTLSVGLSAFAEAPADSLPRSLVSPQHCIGWPASRSLGEGWRRGRDLNSRSPCEDSGFQGQSDQNWGDQPDPPDKPETVDGSGDEAPS